MKKVVKNNKGITIIALVVTVVILLILTGTVIYNSNSPSECVVKNMPENEKKHVFDNVIISNKKLIAQSKDNEGYSSAFSFNFYHIFLLLWCCIFTSFDNTVHYKAIPSEYHFIHF